MDWQLGVFLSLYHCVRNWFQQMLGIKDMSTASGEKNYFPHTHEEKSTVHKSTEVSLLNDSNVLVYTLLYSK